MKPKRYLVIDLTNFKVLYATNKSVIYEQTGISRTSLVDLPDRKTIKDYLIITLNTNEWI